MPGSGIRSDNITAIAEKTKAVEFHTSARIMINTKMNYRNQAMNETPVSISADEQEIKKITDGESMQVEIRFKKPFEDTNQALTTVTAIGPGETKVVNLFYGSNKFPKNIMNLFMDKLVGGDMQTNLQNMKNNLEK